MTLFERMEALEALVTSLQTDFNTLGKHFVSVEETMDAMLTEIDTIKGQINGLLPDQAENINGKNLNSLVGRIIFGYGNDCTNRPVNVNGYFVNIPHNQRATTYGKQFWITRPANNIYIRNLENGTFGAWEQINSKVEDTGWNDLPLLGDVIPYSDANPPQYRRIGNVVWLRGYVKNILAAQTEIGRLPEGFRPAKTYSYVQNTSMLSGNVACTSRLKVATDGVLSVEGISAGAVYGASKWFPIDTSFLID